MEENNQDNKIIVSILEDASETLNKINKSFSKKKEIDDSLNTIAEEVGKIRKRMNQIRSDLDEGIESIRFYKQQLDDALISFNTDYIIPIRNIIVANLPGEIKTEEDVRQYKIRYNNMYTKETEELEFSNRLSNNIYLFENCYDNNKNKGLEYVCIGKIVIDNIDMNNEYYEVTININTEEKSVKNEYREVKIPINNKLRIYNIISTLNTILYYGK